MYQRLFFSGTTSHHPSPVRQCPHCQHTSRAVFCDGESSFRKEPLTQSHQVLPRPRLVANAVSSAAPMHFGVFYITRKKPIDVFALGGGRGIDGGWWGLENWASGICREEERECGT